MSIIKDPNFALIVRKVSTINEFSEVNFIKAKHWTYDFEKISLSTIKFCKITKFKIFPRISLPIYTTVNGRNKGLLWTKDLRALNWALRRIYWVLKGN